MTNVVSQKYGVSGPGTQSYVSNKGRFSTNALDISGSYVGVLFPGDPQTTVTGFAIQTQTLASSGANIIWSAYDANTNQRQCYLGWNASGQLQFYLGNGTALGSASSSSFPANSIIQLEIMATIGSSGSLQCRLNGNTTPILTFAGNTQSSSHAYMSEIRLECSAGGGSQNNWFSDIYMFDTNGSAPNNFLGNKRVLTLAPTADSATAGLNTFSTQPTRTTGSHYLNANTEPPNTSDYNFSATSGQRESYQNGGLPAAVNNVSLVNVWAYMEIDNASPHTAGIAARSSGVDSVGPAINVAQSFTMYNQPFPTDPNTGAAWLNTAVGAAEFGVELLS